MHQDAGPFGQHRAIALLGEREAAFGRQHVQRLPGLHRAVVDDRLRGPGYRDVNDTVHGCNREQFRWRVSPSSRPSRSQTLDP